VAAVAACGPLPRPFGRSDGDAPRPLAENIFLESVEVEPLTGTTLPMGKLLAEAVVQRLEKTYQIPAAIRGLNKSRYILTGHVRNPAAEGAAGTGNAGIVIGWQLDERRGGIVSNFVEEIDATAVEWDYGSPKILESVGDTVSERVARVVLGDRFDAAGSDRYLGRRGIFVAGVTGAPGDGNASLRRAMSVALAGKSLRLADAKDKAAFTLQGDVEMGVPDNGAQTIKIVWTVQGIDGEVLGRAQQNNAVPAGSLDGRWGQTAAFVAAAALDGIAGIIEQHDPSKLRAPALGPEPIRRAEPPPPSRSLPQVPGRAPPPPG
jgi:hypothetical protein